MASCGFRSQGQAQDVLRRDEIAAQVNPSAATRATVKADERAVVISERLSARNGLLRTAVVAIGVVAACLMAASYFPVLGGFLRLLAGGAGIFAGGVFALRSLLSVPEWAVLLALGAVALIAAARVLWHAKGLSRLAHEIRLGDTERAKLSGAAKRVEARIASWREHHAPKGAAA